MINNKGLELKIFKNKCKCSGFPMDGLRTRIVSGIYVIHFVKKYFVTFY
jgi:hypothetical protein